ncbi:hypothetical protein [Sedimenticola thiotaurini]|uniref:Uncharacterized protein n=1 Tax=Sedimenticola thiotaurini TaxID=1543721 RepID=A0A0F7K0I1_9GAMM|nr:hypothetical protein [Sedimenticola thiotaurini]AKH20493.1 hypothetical protein AAY24_09170 [Sedimenticola thiotaurini]
MTDEHGLIVEDELDDLGKQRRDMLEQHANLLDKNSYLVRWGQVVAAMLAEGEMSRDEWRERCSRYLQGEPLEDALKGLEHLE